MVYNGQPYESGWFGGTQILGHLHMLIECSTPETLGMLILSEEHMFLFVYIYIYIIVVAMLWIARWGPDGSNMIELLCLVSLSINI